MEIRIRKAESGDISRLLEIQKKAFLVQAEKYDAYDIPPMVETEADVLLDSDDLIVLVAEAAGIVVGSIRIAYKKDDAEIRRLSVDDDFQGRGIGSSLLIEAEKFCANLKRIWLFTGGQSWKNIALYKKIGYTPFKEEPFKDNFTLIYMEKYLKL